MITVKTPEPLTPQSEATTHFVVMGSEGKDLFGSYESVERAVEYIRDWEGQAGGTITGVVQWGKIWLVSVDNQAGYDIHPTYHRK